MRVEEDRLRSEKDSFRNEGNGAMFLENSDLDGLHRLKLPKIVWSSAEQQFDVKGLQGFDCLVIVGGEGEEESLWNRTMGLHALQSDRLSYLRAKERKIQGRVCSFFNCSNYSAKLDNLFLVFFLNTMPIPYFVRYIVSSSESVNIF